MQREKIHEMKVTTIIYPQQVTNAASFNTAHTTTCIDTLGWDSTTFLLSVGADSSGDEVFKVYHTATSVTDAGAAASATDVMVVRDDNTVVESPATTGFISVSTTGQEHSWLISYIGDKRWVRIQCTTGTQTYLVSLTCVQERGHRPYYTAV